MKVILRARIGWVVLAAAYALAGCAPSERDIAKKQDLTGETIQQASSLFAADKELSRYPIVVDGFRGAMRLKGEVATEAQKIRAEKVLWAVPGVKSVENHLAVRGVKPMK